MVGPTILVTGATAGIGLATARELAGQGAELYITGRDPDRGSAAVTALRAGSGNENIHFLAAEHSTVRGNQELAERLATRVASLDVLVNNVGGSPYPTRRLTPEGHEWTMATNFMGPAALTAHLLPLLMATDQAAPGARVVNVVSAAFRFWKGDPFTDLDAEQDYVAFKAYAHAKLLNLLWTMALARRLADDGVVVNAVNPGMAWTPGTQALTRDSVPAWRYIWPIVRFFQRRAAPEKAARAPIYLAVSPQAATISGTYVESNAKPAKTSETVSDPAVQDRAYELAASLIENASGMA